MSYSVQISVIGDDSSELLVRVMDNHDTAEEAIEHAKEVCAQEYARTGIDPQPLDTDYEPDPFDASATPWAEAARRGIYVFGSNLRGVHGGGNARSAHLYYGAEMGVGEGLTGDSYALPTKDENIDTLPLDRIQFHVDRFIYFAQEHPEMVFFVTKVGTGLAGYTEEDIKPLFRGVPANVGLPSGWTD